MTINRSRLNWGLFLIVLGAVPLAVEVGLIDKSLTGQLVTLWPVVLIALGIGLMLRLGPAHTAGGLLVAGTFGLILGALIAGGAPSLAGSCAGNVNAAEPSISRSGELSPTGTVALELSCVELTIDRQAGTQWLVQAQQGSGAAPVIEQVGDRLELRTTDRFFTGNSRRAWHVTLPSALGAVSLTTNAARGSIDLGGGSLDSFSATLNASDADLDLSALEVVGGGFAASTTLNASSATVRLPASGSWSLTANASSLKMCVAPQTALRIAYGGTLSSDNFASAGLERVGGAWQTPGFDSAATRLDVDFSANVSSTNLDRSGGCQ